MLDINIRSMAEPTLEGTARKRGQYRGAWRARYFVLNAAQSRLDYWESREDKEANQKPRGAIKVRGASALDDKDEPYSLVAVSYTHLTLPSNREV